MENTIELTSQPTRRSRATTIEDNDKNDLLSSASTNTSKEHIALNPPIENDDTKKEPKKSFGQRLYAKIPPYQLTTIIVKASIAILIALLFVFEKNCRAAIGQAGILVPIGTLLYFPVRPIGVQLEASFQGLFGALLGSAWCFLGMFLANLARNPEVALPVQPASSAILAIFMVIGVFGLTYVRVKFAQANFGTIFASMIVAFCLTQASVTPGFQPTVVYTFLKPIATAAAVALMVDVFLWPENSVTKYVGVLNKSLTEYNNFFKEHADQFLSAAANQTTMTLPSLHARLQNSVLKLIDTKREVHREILFNKLSHEDISHLTRLVKTMRSPLHGIGLSLIMKKDHFSADKPYFSSDDKDLSEHKREFVAHLEELRKVSQELSDTCVSVLKDCTDRLTKEYGGRPRSLKSTLLWPFPRIFLADYAWRSKLESDNLLTERLEAAIKKYELRHKKSTFVFIEPNSKTFEDRFNGSLQIVYLFQYNLMEHANHLRSLVALVEDLGKKRVNRKFWVPHTSLRKYFRPTSLNPDITGQAGTANVETTGTNDVNTSNDLNLTNTMTRNGDANDSVELTGLRSQKGVIYPRDPDVNPPVTKFEHFFYKVHIYTQWMKSVEAIFALKTAVGFVLISLPAFLPQSAGWFFAWRGQWATITLMMWMFPMAGMFFFSLILRVLGTILGGVLGIIVWEIVRGNPYGLVILTFFVMWPLYYIFFTSQIINMVAIMTQITLLLVVCYEYQYVVSGAATYDSVEVVAGKRIMLVIIGVSAAAILSMIPKPVTGRVELRKRISKTLRDMSKLYGILVGDILTCYDNKQEPTPGQKKAFRKLALSIRRQIADEQTFLKLSKLEPPMRGKFPVEIYTVLVEKVDNMADLLEGMAYAARSIDRSWQRNLVQVIRKQRKEYLASLLAIMKLLSATLASKMALPPFMFSPKELREGFTTQLSEAIVQCPEKLDNETFPSYCAYAVNSYKFSDELGEVIECVEKLVGIEDPEQWLLLHA